MLTGDRLVCVFVEPQTVGEHFSTWLLHITILPWFRVKGGSKQIAFGLAKSLTPISAFDVKVGEKAAFGPKKDRLARLLVNDAPLYEIERRARNYFHKKRAWLVDETTKRPRRFQPHITTQEGKNLRKSDGVHVDKLYIVEQKGNYKEIVAEIKLGEYKT